MINREMVLKGLECCASYNMDICSKECPYDYWGNPKCSMDMARDALELLKEYQDSIISLQHTINELNKAIEER